VDTQTAESVLDFALLNTDELELEAWPIPRGEWGVTVEGEPEYAGRFLYRSEDRRTVIGVERLGPCTLRGTHIGETLFFLEGKVTARPPGRAPYTLKAGDFCHFPPGTEDVWEIEETYVKLFHIHSEEPLPF
jgi:uncharacterized cupin superfamily protein